MWERRFLRNAYISIAHTPPIRRLKDGRTVSCLMPYVRHIDHPEHDIKCLCTEQGYAINPEIRAARRRAEDIIEKCGLLDLAQSLVHRNARRCRKIEAAYLWGTHRDSQRVVPMTVQQIGR